MNDNTNILQLNIRGILSNETQYLKCHHLNKILESKHIDVVLLQEWSAIKRCEINNTDSEVFPLKYFPNYLVHFHSTETAILYHKDLCVTTLNTQPNYLKPNHRLNFHTCGIILHSQTTDYGIYSVYRPQKADPNQIFQYQFETDHILIGGDFNIHHPIWGSNKACKNGTNFLKLVTESNFKILNQQTPTRIDPRNNTLTSIDLSLSSHNLRNISWKVNQTNHNPKISDHFQINTPGNKTQRIHIHINGTYHQKKNGKNTN